MSLKKVHSDQPSEFKFTTENLDKAEVILKKYPEKKISEKNIVEVIFALSATIEADTTSFYIFKTLKNLDVKVSVLARGIPVGDQLEYTDEVTLARSIQNRRPYESNLSNH